MSGPLWSVRRLAISRATTAHLPSDGGSLPLLFLLFPILLLLLSPGCSSTEELRHAEYPRKLRDVRGTPSIVFTSDTQSPLWAEELFIRADDNDVATRKIFEAASGDTSCVAMFHLGDFTPLGAVNSYWEDFDLVSLPLRDAGIPLYPLFGNHEYMPWKDEGIYNMLVRFPFLRTSWYQRRIGPLAVVLLNSNFSRLSDSERTAQLQWYEQTLQDLDNDTTVSRVIVGCHHSPYTNSMIVEPSEDVEKVFVPPFLESRKAKLFLSGHAHAFEHFQLNGKEFLVIGGGGGLLHPLRTGEQARWRDKVPHPSGRSFFHYLRITPGPDRIIVDVLMLSPDFMRFELRYSFEIPAGDVN